ncbi:MAG: phosphate ABC transporter permease PstA [Acidimicrobiales bacterium]|jgi:phosphate transport system permease protein
MATDVVPATLDPTALAQFEPPAVAGAPVPVPDEDVPTPLHRVALEDVYAVVGSLVGSFGLVWLVFSYVLPLSGTVGFVLCWDAAFLAMYAGVTALSHPRPVVVSRVMAAVIVGLAVLVGFVLMTVVVYVVAHGYHAVAHLNFFTQSASAGSLTGTFKQGGIFNALVGSLIQVGAAIAIALPLGIGTAVFMTETRGWFVKLVRTVVEAMTAVPDLLAGLFIYVVFVLPFHGNYPWGHKNGFAVSLALAVAGTPIIARSAEVALRVVPGGLREAGLALGASHWHTVRRIVLPTARPGLATALILAVARMIGESAPLLIVSGFTTFFNGNPFDAQPMISLPLYVYETLRSGQPVEIVRGFGAAFVLLFIVFILFAATRVLARQRVSAR